jgi:hypothetical protein
VSRLSAHSLGAWTGLLVGAAVLLPVMLISRRLVRCNGSAQKQVLTALVCCGVLLSIYHLAYDLLLLALPAATLARALHEGSPFRGIHVAQVLLFAVLALNYMATDSVLTALQLPRDQRLILVSANGLALTALFGLYLMEARRVQSSRS